MRITSTTLFNELLSGMQKNQEQNSILSQRLASSKKILAPSDNVIGLARAMDYQVSINDNNQYQTNIDTATNNLNITATVLSSVADLVSQVKHLADSSSSGSTDANIQASNAMQASQLRDQLFSLANDKLGNNYFFAGFKTDQQPYAAGTYAYQGDAGIVNVQIDKNVTMASNIPGSDAFSYAPPAPYQVQTANGLNVHYTAGAGTTVNVEIRDAADTTVLDTFSFSNVIQMTNLLASAIGSNDTSRIQALADPFDKMLNQSQNMVSVAGERLSSLKNQSTLLTNNSNSLENARAAIQDMDSVDLSATGMQLQQINTTLQALYSTSSKILPQSLFDFLK